jgi:preprotein translocase subunit SecA
VILCREHLAALDILRQGIHLRSYAQKNPKQEYKREALELFERLLDTVRTDVTRMLLLVQIRTEAAQEQLAASELHTGADNLKYQHANFEEAVADAATRSPNPVSGGIKVGRNDPCPCGSGKKFKHCHGKLN